MSWRIYGCVWLLAVFVAVRVAHSAPPASDVASRLDALLATMSEHKPAEPAALADDAAFLRRVSLDLVGRIPTVAETREFLDERNPAKRQRAVTRLISSPLFARHAARFWRKTWLPEADSPRFAGMAEDVENWLAGQFQSQTSCDRIVRALLSADPLSPGAAPGEQTTPTAFLSANEFKPENLAAASARGFLGLNLDCAECHDHPFARWTREEFWQLAAFFSPPSSGDQQGAIPRLKIAETESFVEPRFLDQAELRVPLVWGQATGRHLLANWVATPENPYFARNLANRTWAHLIGRGLVEPLDDLSPDNPPAHPELLAALSEALVDSGFDLRYLTEVVVLTKAYQRESPAASDAAPASQAGDAACFAFGSVRGLTADQLYDSLCVAAGLSAREMSAVERRRRFVARYETGQSPDQRSIPQALALLNGELVAELTDPERSPLLRSIAEAPFLSPADKIETLFLAALGRLPTPGEAAPLLAHIEQGSRDAAPGDGLADVLWALFNCSEFNTNH